MFEAENEAAGFEKGFKVSFILSYFFANARRKNKNL
jgi:hypothetical protein